MDIAVEPVEARFFVVVEKESFSSTAPLEVLNEDSGFLFLAGESLLPAHADLFRHYLEKPRFTCCDLSVGLAVTVAGTPWNDYCADHFWHLAGWIVGLGRLYAQGDPSATTTFVWDESYLQLARDGDRLTMLDGQPELGRVHAPRVTVGLGAFAAEVLREAGVCADLMRLLLQDVDEQIGPHRELMARLAGESDRPVATREERALKGAILAREVALPHFFEDLQGLARLVADSAGRVPESRPRPPQG